MTMSADLLKISAKGRCFLVAAAVIVTGATPALAKKAKAPPKPARKKEKPQPVLPGRNTRVKLSGYRTLLFTTQDASGDAQGFRSQNGLYFSKTKLQQEGHLTLSGALNEGVNVEGELNERAFDDPTFRLSVKGQGYMARVGDFDHQFPMGPLLTFTKAMRGVSVQGSTRSGVTLHGLFTKQKSKTERQAFFGRGIRGPYQLGNISVVEGSETVRLNGVVLDPSDYAFDYFLGEITFKNAVASTDQLEITYESALFLSSASSGLSGLAVEYAPKGEKVRAYAAGFGEGVNQLRVSPVVSDARNFTAADLAAGGVLALNVRRVRRGSVVLERVEAAGGFTLLVEGVDWKMDYPGGVLTFLAPVAAGTSYQISFDYYDDNRVRRVLDEELNTTAQSTFVLQRATVYSGTETVELYQGGALLQTLAPGVDYLLDESNNTLILLRGTLFPDAALGRVVRIDYEVVDNDVTGGGRGNRNGYSAGVDWRPAPGLLLGFDAAATKGDISPKTVQVSELTVGVGDGVSAVFVLPQQPVLGSQEIYFDDTFSPDSRKSLGVDYTLEPGLAAGTGQIRFRVAPPTGTVVLASYRYLPTLPAGRKETGNAWQARLGADFWQGRLRFQGQYRGKDRAFSPNNQLNNLESTYLDASVAAAIARPLTVSLWRTQSKTNLDFTTGNKQDLTEDTAELSYQQGVVENFYVRSQMLRRETPAAAGLVDLKRRKNSVGLVAKPFGENWTLNAKAETASQEDETNRTGDRDTALWEAGAAYESTGAWRGSARLYHNAYTAHPAPGAVGGKTSFDSLGRELFAGFHRGIWALNASYDNQRQDDSRAGRDFTIENTQVDLSVTPKGPLERVSVFLYRRDHPNGDLGSTRTTTATTSLTWRLATDWFFTPSYTSNTAAQGAGGGVLSSDNDDQATAGLLEFRPTATSGFKARFSLSTGDRQSRTVLSTGAVSAVAGDTRQHLLRLDYLKGRYTAAFSWDDNRQGQTVGADTRQRNRFLDQSFRLNPRWTMRTLVNRQETLNAPATHRDKALVELNSRVGKAYELLLSYEWQNNDTGAAATDYDGHIAKAQLKATF